MKKGVTYGEFLFGKKEHKEQMKRVQQSEKKVYCKNCEFEHGYLVCYWDALLLLKEELTKIEIRTYLNENHNCLYYRRKWWKFWIK